MSYLERNIARGIHDRRERIAELDQTLRELNENFPGQRKMPVTKRDPQYEEVREPIVDERRMLSREIVLLKEERP